MIWANWSARLGQVERVGPGEVGEGCLCGLAWPLKLVHCLFGHAARSRIGLTKRESSRNVLRHERLNGRD